MLDLFISAFITFFVVIDPPGCAPIYASLTTDAGKAERRSMAIRAVFVASLILLTFGLFGEDLLKALGISLDSFRIAGGIMLFLIALEMVFEKRTERREERAQKAAIRAGYRRTEYMVRVYRMRIMGWLQSGGPPPEFLPSA